MVQLKMNSQENIERKNFEFFKASTKLYTILERLIVQLIRYKLYLMVWAHESESELWRSLEFSFKTTKDKVQDHLLLKT